MPSSEDTASSQDTRPWSLADLAEREVATAKLKGAGPKKLAAMGHLDITSLYDLLTHYPRRYIDRTKEATIADLEEGSEGMVLVTIGRSDSRRLKGRRTILTVNARDETGRIKLTFFNQPWRQKQLTEGMDAVVFGKAENYRGTKQMTNPIVDVVGGDQTARFVPVYPQSDKAGISTLELGRWISEVVRRVNLRRGFAEPLPESIRKEHKLANRSKAFQGIHLPESMADVEIARKRLVFDELFRIQVALVQRKRLLEANTLGVEHTINGELSELFVANLPYSLTGAQSRTVDEILRDMDAGAPMHRLLQGDVGSGKTVVALAALLTAVQGGHQGALMAPTEVLAEQHFLAVSEMVDGLIVPDQTNLLGERPLTIKLLTNRATKSERDRMAEGLTNGTVDLLIGTHALIQESVEFNSLGLVVIDEQHRFGVEQRAALRDKGAGEAVPDVLVMTATPIPRTAAMTVYGDLDVSVLDEMPPGRTPITTTWVLTGDTEAESDPELADIDRSAASSMTEADVWQQVRTQVQAGRQAYVVCPLIDESEKLEAASAEETYARLAHDELEDLRVGLLHGRMTSADKEQTMDLFRSGDLDVLIATTVIEVGVDVPNSTVMVILDADRFGIAQLHQLRGRVGRGGGESWCYLLGAGRTQDGATRLGALVASTDGFELAEVDLELRGEGTIMGERQKGRSDLKLASLRRDKYWVEKAREAAFMVIDADPDLKQHPVLARELVTLLEADEADFLLKS